MRIQKRHGWAGIAIASLFALAAFAATTNSSRPASQPTTEPAHAAEPVVASPASPAAEPVAFLMRNVRLHSDADAVLDVSTLEGHLISNTNDIPVFDDQQSFHVAVDHAEISIDATSLTKLVNSAFAYDGAPISHVEVAIRDGKLEEKGRLKRGVSWPFSMVANVGPKNGRILVHPEKVRVAGIPAAKVMKLVGLELDDLITVKGGRGIDVQQNDLLLEPSQMMKSPQVRGPVTSARIEGNRLLLVLGKSPASKAGAQAGAQPEPPARIGQDAVPSATNVISFRGGRIRFGRLTMTDADLQLIDADPGDPFDFYPAKYRAQLVAGYSRNTPEGGLRTMMPDYNDIPGLKDHRLPAPR